LQGSQFLRKSPAIISRLFCGGIRARKEVAPGVAREEKELKNKVFLGSEGGENNGESLQPGHQGRLRQKKIRMGLGVGEIGSLGRKVMEAFCGGEEAIQKGKKGMAAAKIGGTS